MATFQQLQVSVSKKLLDPSNTVVALSDVQDAINSAVDYWKFRRFWFNTVRDTSTLTAQSGVIPLPTDFLVPIMEDGGFTISWSNRRYPLKKIHEQQYDALVLDNGYGLPQVYANLEGVYACYPLPDQDYTVMRSYLKQYVALAGNSDTNDFTDNAPRLIEYWTLACLYRDFRQDATMSDAFFNSAQSEYNNLSIMTAKSNATGSLVLHS